MPKELTQALIEEWVALANGTFTVKNIWDEIGIESLNGKKHLRIILKRLEDKGIIKPTSRSDTFRRVDGIAKPIEWQTANPEKFLPIVLPFGLSRFVKIYPKSIIIIAGVKSAGKTAILYNLIKDNMNLFDVDLYNSETGAEQMKERFDALGGIPNPAPFRVYERYDNFADVINPNSFSVIDYLDFNSEVYLVGTEIDNIFRKLNNVAVIAIQKPPASTVIVKGEKKTINRDLAYGGAFSAKRSQLYLSLSNDEDKHLRTCKVVYAKARMNGNVNPVNMQWSFTLDERYGIQIKDYKRYVEEGR